MFTRAARKALSKARKTNKQSPMVQILLEGEKAARQGKSIDTNPYKIGTEDAELWTEGWNDVTNDTL